LANSLAYENPSDINIFSQISTNSGTTIAHDLNRAFKLSGSSVLPAYPGFIVIKNPTVSYNPISPSSINKNLVLFSFNASNTHDTYEETTDKTSIEILLNSSKQPHAPDYDNPMNIYAITSFDI